MQNAHSLVKTGHYGSATNVWQVGLIMWSLKRKMRSPDWNRMQVFRSKLSNNLNNSGETCGYREDMQEEGAGGSLQYSQGLRALINECLLINSAERPSPENLVARTRHGLVSLSFLVTTTSQLHLHPIENSACLQTI